MGELSPPETAPGAVVRGSAEPRRLGMPARFVLLCLGFAALGAAIGLFATGSWAWGVVLVLLGLIALAALGEATRRTGDARPQHSSGLAADGRAHAATAAEVWRTRLAASLVRWRTRSRLDAITSERGPAFQALGEAVWRGDSDAERVARERLVAQEQEAKRIEDELAERLARADERIRHARLPVQETTVVTPNEPTAAYPPPDEGTPPTPAPDPGQTESE